MKFDMFDSKTPALFSATQPASYQRRPQRRSQRKGGKISELLSEQELAFEQRKLPRNKVFAF